FCIFEQGKFIEASDAESFFKSDNTLHSLLYEGCGMPHIWRIVQNSNLDYVRARVLNVSDTDEQMKILYEQHKGIVSAVFDKNVKAAQDIMTEHINKVMGDVAVLKKEYPEYFG
ncbi:MAG: FCD domain-containing protein, partial [Megasphaera sp.]|nr:FCD domain-containing protein [Megasphaera sp.]